LEKKVKILGFVGSLRKGSYNKALMRTAVELTPENALIDVFDLPPIPPVQPGFGERTAANNQGL